MMLRQGLRVEHVPSAFASLMGQHGRLPKPPADVYETIRGMRAATFAEDCALQWLMCWQGEKVGINGFIDPVGAAAYRDVYDYHTGCDVREVTYIAGTPRSVVALLRFIAGEAEKAERMMIGSFSAHNRKFIRALERLGGTLTRVGFEHRTGKYAP